MTTFTKEQLIERCKSQADYAQAILDIYPDDVGAAESLRIAEIALAALTAEPSPELVAARAKIEWLSGKLNAATDCRCDGATFYDASGRERCASCGRDI